MKKLITIIAVLLFGINSFSQESFKKKYFIPTKLANEIFLKKDTIIKYENMNDKEKEIINKKYINGEYVDVTTEELIDGKKVTAIRRIKVDDTFKKTLSINRPINVKDCGIRGFVKFEEDGKLLVNRYLKIDNDGKYTRHPIHYYQLKNRQTIKLWFTEVSVSALTIPIKYRFKGKNGLQEDFSTAFNANLFVGYTLGRSSFFHQEKVGDKINTHKFTVGALFGTSTVVLNQSNTSLDPVPLGEKETITKGLASIGIGATYAFNKINIGIFGGHDYAIGDGATKWNYNKEPWIGFAIGYSLFNF